MSSNHLILCHPLLLLPSIFPSIRVFSSESALRIRWPKFWSFSFSLSPPNEYSGLVSFRTDWFDLLAVPGTLESLPSMTTYMWEWPNIYISYTLKCHRGQRQRKSVSMICLKLTMKLLSEIRTPLWESEKAMAPHSSTLAWKIPRVEECGGLQSMGSLRVGHDWGLHFHFSLSCIGEGNGNPLQCSCLEKTRDRGAWWAAIYGVTQSRTRLKWLGSSSSSSVRIKSLSGQAMQTGHFRCDSEYLKTNFDEALMSKHLSNFIFLHRKALPFLCLIMKSLKRDCVGCV